MKKMLVITKKRGVLIGISIIIIGLSILLTPFLTQTIYFFSTHSSANITIDYTTPIRTLDPRSIAMDESGYFAPNVIVNDQLEQQRIQTLGIKYMRMYLVYSTPGDPTSQIVCGGDGCDSRWTGDQWIQAIKSVGAVPVIQVPYNQTDAVNLVKHFNKTTNNPVHYWIIGNEPDLNGMSAPIYSNIFNHYYDAMKAVDPTIKVGGGTTAWYNEPFLQTFLQYSGSRTDFVDFHGYAQQGDTNGNYTVLFQKAAQYGTDILNLRALIQKIVPARSSQIGIEVGEWELNWGGSAQDNTNFHAVWAASVLGHILTSGGIGMFYADKGNALYGASQTITDAYGHVVHVTLDDTNPAYHGIGMFTGESLFRGFGNTIVSASTTLPNTSVFASDNPKNIVVTNESSSQAQTAIFSLNGVTSGTIDIWRKDESVLFPNPPRKLGTILVQHGTFTYQLPPMSVTTFVLTPGLPPTPTPTHAATPSPVVTVTPSATPIVPPAYNNIGTSNDSNPGAGNFDGVNSYSAQALQGVGIRPGGNIAFNRVSFTWPTPAAGMNNNYVANGQTIPVTPVAHATTLAFLGAATAGNASGTCTIIYTDGTTQPFSLVMSDWASTSPPAFGNQVVATMPYRNTPNGPQSNKPSVFYADVALIASKTVQSVRLPSTTNGGQMHIFAIATR